MKYYAIAALLVLNSSNVTGAEVAFTREDFRDPLTIDFTSTEFTQPRISLATSFNEFYFDSLGEIYKSSMAGGKADKVDLGGGWKDLPAISRDGTQLAYRSNVDGLSRVWVKDLRAATSPVPASADVNVDPLEIVWTVKGTLVWSGRDNLRGSHRGFEISAVRPSTFGSASSLIGQPVKRGIEDALLGASGDGRYIYLFQKPVNGLKKIDLMTGEESISDGILPEDASQIRVSKDGGYVGFRSTKSGGFLHILRLSDRSIAKTDCKLEEEALSFKNPFVDATYELAGAARFALLSRNGKFHRCDFGAGESAIPVSVDFRISMEKSIRPDRAMNFIPQILFPTYSKTRREIAFSMQDRVWVLDLDTNKTRRISSGNRFETMPAFSKSGRMLAFVEQKDNVSVLKTVDMATGRSSSVHRANGLVHANPEWANCDCKIAFALADTRLNASAKSQILAIDLRTRKTSVIASVEPSPYTESFHPAPQWDIDDKGVFYLVDVAYEKRLVHQFVGEEATEVLSADSEVTGFRMSPSYKNVSVLYRNGVAMFPLAFAGNGNENRHISIEDIASLRHVFNGAFDYAIWKDDEHLIGTVQDKVYLTESGRPDKEIGSVQNLEGSTKRPSQRHAYVGAKIVTMNGSEVIEEGVVITAGSKIEYVGPAANARIGDASIVDVRGKTIIPGLVDVHQHTLGYNYGNEPSEGNFLFPLAAYGVTTAYDAAPRSLPQSSHLTFVSSADDYNGATYYSSGLILLGEFGHPSSVRINSIDDARKYIGRLATSNVPVVKEYLNPTESQRRWVVQASQELGLGVTSHLDYSLRSKLSSIRDGYTGMEHELLLRPRPFYHDIQSFLTLSGVSLTPALVDADSITSNPYLASRSDRGLPYQCLIDGHIREQVSRNNSGSGWEAGQPVIPEWKMSSFRQYANLLENGASVSIGSHGDPPGLSTHWEMWALALGGASPMSVLRAATLNGAMKLGLENEIGALREGMDADMVVLNSNPLDDIFASEDIAMVVRRGRVIEWPVGATWPASWTTSSNWSECKEWFKSRSLLKSGESGLRPN